MPYIGYGVENTTVDLSEQLIIASGNSSESLFKEVNEVTELLIFVNGTLLLTNEYSISGIPAKTINFTTPPSAGAQILVRYLQKSVDVISIGVTKFENRTGSITLESADMQNKVDTNSLQNDSVTSPKLSITYGNQTLADTAGLNVGDVYFDTSIDSFRYKNSSGWYNAVGSDSNGNVNLSGNLSILDNKVVNLGTGIDTILQHYNNGSGTVYTEIQNKTNDFYIAQNVSGSVKITKWVNGVTNDLSELMAAFTPDAAVELYYDNLKKFETTSTGVTVTGNIDSDGSVNLSDGSPFVTTFQTITPTADRTISIPDQDGTLALKENNGDLVLSGKIVLDDTAQFITTIQTVLPTQDRYISIPDASGTVGLIDTNGTLTASTFDGNLKTSANDPINNYEINFEYVSDTSINIRMKGSDGVVRSVNLTLS